MYKLIVNVILLGVLFGGCLINNSFKKYDIDFEKNAISCNGNFETLIEYDSLSIYQYIDTLSKEFDNSIGMVLYDRKNSIESPMSNKFQRINASIKNCRDTIKAKKHLYSHLKNKYNITIRDTLKQIVEYSFATDSLTGYTNCSSKYWELLGVNYWCEDKSEIITIYTHKCKNIRSLLGLIKGAVLRSYHQNELVRIHAEMDTIGFGKINYKLYEAKYLYHNIPTFQKYLKDSFNLDLKLTNRYNEKHLLFTTN